MIRLRTIYIFLFLSHLACAQNNSISQQVVDSLPCIIVDKDPQFPGGNDSLLRFISRNIHYPPIQRDEPEGTVWIKFIVERNGKLTGATIEKGFAEYYDKEALRLVNAMPDWTPGQKNGKTVRTVRFLPIKFRLR